MAAENSMISIHAAPRVTMVLPVHNGEAFVAEAIDSILAQSFTDFELICVDDGSSDSTPAILADYAARDSRIHIVTNRPNKGLPGALNSGFAVAKGALHSWTSDDNILRPHMLERLVAALDANPTAQIVNSSFCVIDQSGALLYHVSPGPIERLLYGNNVGASFLYRAEVTQALNGYDEALFGAEDYDFWLRARRHFKFTAVNEDLYLYRRHSGSLTDKRARKIHRMCASIIRREAALLSDDNEKATVILTTALQNRIELRLDMIWDAFRASPQVVLSHPYQIGRWAASWLWHRLVD